MRSAAKTGRSTQTRRAKSRTVRTCNGSRPRASPCGRRVLMGDAAHLNDAAQPGDGSIGPPADAAITSCPGDAAPEPVASMQRIPAGAFHMGCNGAEDPECGLPDGGVFEADGGYFRDTDNEK